MNQNKGFVFITKDAMCNDYLPIYGNKFWKTPNIDEIAAQGTVFTNYYCAAPSSTMAMYSFITGVFAHETKYELYQRCHDVYEGETIFTKLIAAGYECHIVWDDLWNPTPEYVDCYQGAQIHSLHNFRQGVGAHYRHEGQLLPDLNKEEETFRLIEETVQTILSSGKKVFLWIHFPHVIYGRVSYGGDIDLFDRYVGMLRRYFDDDAIAISADHGNMNGKKGKLCYGFDVYQSASRIPLITPRIGDLERYDGNVSAVDLYSMLNGSIVDREFIYCDTQYCAQKNRRLAILYKNYKYIYNKKTGVEELYDVSYDPGENFNLIADYNFDVDRKVNAPSRELYFYPLWDEMPKIREIMRNEKNRIWRNGSFKTILKSNAKDVLRPLYNKFVKKKI